MSRHTYYNSGYDADGYDANGYDDRGYQEGQDGPSYQIFNSRKSQPLRYSSSRDGPGYVVKTRPGTPGAEVTEFRGRRGNTDGYPDSPRHGRSREGRRTGGTSRQHDTRYETGYRPRSVPRYTDSRREGGRSSHEYRPRSPARTYETEATYRPRSRSSNRERRRSRERRHTTGRSPRRDTYQANSGRQRSSRTHESTYEPERGYGQGREGGAGTTVRKYVDGSGRPIAKVKRMDRGTDIGGSTRYAPEKRFAEGSDSDFGTAVRQYSDENGEVVAKVYEEDDDGYTRRY